MCALIHYFRRLTPLFPSPPPINYDHSGDTGGLLLDDWTTPNLDKLALLARVQIDPSTVARTSDAAVCVVSGSYTNPLCAAAV